MPRPLVTRPSPLPPLRPRWEGYPPASGLEASGRPLPQMTDRRSEGDEAGRPGERRDRVELGLALVEGREDREAMDRGDALGVDGGVVRRPEVHRGHEERERRAAAVDGPPNADRDQRADLGVEGADL